MSNRPRKIDPASQRGKGRTCAQPAAAHAHCPDPRTAWYTVHTPGIGVCRLGAALYQKWVALGGAQSPLGLPVLDEQPVPDGRGRFALFEWGGIYAAPGCGVHAVHGVLFDRWLLAGGAPDLFGYPCTDVLPARDGQGSFCHFEWGTLYSCDGICVCAVLEPVRSTWLLVSGEAVIAGAELPAMTACTARGFGHWLLNNGAHGEPGQHALCGYPPCAASLLSH